MPTATSARSLGLMALSHTWTDPSLWWERLNCWWKQTPSSSLEHCTHSTIIHHSFQIWDSNLVRKKVRRTWLSLLTMTIKIRMGRYLVTEGDVFSLSRLIQYSVIFCGGLNGSVCTSWSCLMKHSERVSGCFAENTSCLRYRSSRSSSSLSWPAWARFVGTR